MANLRNLDAETGANFIGDDASPALTITSVGGGAALRLERTMTGNATVAALELSNGSVASGAVIKLSGTSFVSATTIKFTTGGVAGSGAIRVALTGGVFGWIPVLPDGAVTAAVVEA